MPKSHRLTHDELSALSTLVAFSHDAADAQSEKGYDSTADDIRKKAATLRAVLYATGTWSDDKAA